MRPCDKLATELALLESMSASPAAVMSAHHGEIAFAGRDVQGGAVVVVAGVDGHPGGDEAPQEGQVAGEHQRAQLRRRVEAVHAQPVAAHNETGEQATSAQTNGGRLANYKAATG